MILVDRDSIRQGRLDQNNGMSSSHTRRGNATFDTDGACCRGPIGDLEARPLRARPSRGVVLPHTNPAPFGMRADRGIYDKLRL